MRHWLKISILSSAISAVVAIAFVLFLISIAPTWLPSTALQTAQEAQQDSTGPSGENKGLPDNTAPRRNELAGDVSRHILSERPDPWWSRLIEKVAWPVFLLCALLLIAYNRRLARIFGSGFKVIRKISAGGVQMEISSEAVDQVRKELRSSFEQLVADARIEYERMSELQNIDTLLASVIERTVLKKHTDLRGKGIRATIHVQDIVFKDFLYQLVDYYPKGGGADRRFSQRYGIIGRSWRSGKSHGTGDAFGDVSSEDALVEEWGMTKGESHGILASKPSCLSILLKSGDVAYGILYIDSSIREAFGENTTAQAFAESLETEPSVVNLANAVERTLEPLRLAGPNLDLKDSRR